MPIEFACTSCSRLLRVPDGSSGNQCQCPACQTLLQIPYPEQAVEPSDSPLPADPNGPANESGAPFRNPVDDKDSLHIPCPKCNFVLTCAPNLLGTKGQCRNCNHIFVIALDSSTAASLAPATGLVFNCPECDQLFEGAEEMRGRRGKCHACGAVFEIQLKSTQPEQTPAAQEPGSLSNPSTPNATSFGQQEVASSQRVSESDLLPADESGDGRALPAGQHSAFNPTVSTGKQATTAAESGSQSQQPAGTPAAQTAQTEGAIQLACSSCNGLMEVPASAAGQTTACPFCQQLLQIPIRSVPQVALPSQALSNSATAPSADSLWTELEDLSASAGGSPLDTTNPYQATASSSAAWSAPRSASRNAVTFGNIFSLAMERAFPNCLAGALVYGLTAMASSLVFFGGLRLTGLFLQAAQIRDQTTAITIVTIVAVMAALASICISTAGFCVLCNGALASMRKKHAGADALFSTGNAFGPMLVYLFLLTVAGVVVGLIPRGLAMLLGTDAAIVIALVALALVLLMVTASIGLCLTPFAILDGEAPFAAMATSLSLFRDHGGPLLGTMICGFLIYFGVSLVTCGLGALLLVGFPFYVLAAAYHLATR